MSISTSEPTGVPSTSSGLSPQALFERHAARQRLKHGALNADDRPSLKRLRRLRDLQHIPSEPEDPIDPTPSTRPACKPSTANLGTAAEPPNAHHAEAKQKTGPDDEQDHKHASAANGPRKSVQQENVAKQKQRADAPRHLADPLASKATMRRRRGTLEVLHLFKGKVSQALGQRKHLRPAIAQESTEAHIQDKAMSIAVQKQQKPHGLASKGRAAIRYDRAAPTGKHLYRQDAKRLKMDPPEELPAQYEDRYQDLGNDWEAVHEPEAAAEVDQPATCGAPLESLHRGGQQQQKAKGPAHTSASIAQCSPLDQAREEECQPPARLPAVPPERYMQQLQDYLLQRFCQASGLSTEQVRHPASVQQGIASLVSALHSPATTPDVAGKNAKIDEKQAVSPRAVKPSAPAAKCHKHNSAPGCLRSTEAQGQIYKAAMPAKSMKAAASDPMLFRSLPSLSGGRASSDLLVSSTAPSGLQEAQGLSQGMGIYADLWQQEGGKQGSFKGMQGVSLSFTGIDSAAGLPNMRQSASSPALAKPEASMPNLSSPTLGHDDDLYDWLDSVQGPEPSQDRMHWIDQDKHQGNMRTILSASPGISLTAEPALEGITTQTQSMGVLPCSSPKLRDPLQQHAVTSFQDRSLAFDDRLNASLKEACPDEHLPISFMHLNDCLNASFEAACPQHLTALPEADISFLETDRSAEADLHISGWSDMQLLRRYRQAEKASPKLDRIDEACVNDISMDTAGPGDIQDPVSGFQAEIDVLFGNDLNKPLHRSRKTDSHMTSKSNSTKVAWTVPGVGSDPVAAFSEFCDSLAM